MDSLTRGIRVLHHSAIRLEDDQKVLYFDPFGLERAPHDADYIFVTHDHYDHFSPEDIRRVARQDTVLIVPESIREVARSVALPLLAVKPGQTAALPGIVFRTVPAYNLNKSFHPRENGWVGYITEADGRVCYVAGDTDCTPEALSVRCDVALLPIGGTYTMDAREAADLARSIRPRVVIPTHYGSVVGSPEDGARFAALLKEDVPCRLLMERP